jgi:hypothetical protein
MSQTEALPRMSTSRRATGMSDHAAPLIQVPRVSLERPRSRLLEPCASATRRPGRSRRPRRRLRREVRLAACALVTLLPLGLTWSHLSSARPNRTHLLTLPSRFDRAGASVETAGWSTLGSSASPPPPVLLSIEPLNSTVDSEGETPVVFPGYLLPDDHHEESAHEGS